METNKEKRLTQSVDLLKSLATKANEELEGLKRESQKDNWALEQASVALSKSEEKVTTLLVEKGVEKHRLEMVERQLEADASLNANELNQYKQQLLDLQGRFDGLLTDKRKVSADLETAKAEIQALKNQGHRLESELEQEKRWYPFLEQTRVGHEAYRKQADLAFNAAAETKKLIEERLGRITVELENASSLNETRVNPASFQAVTVLQPSLEQALQKIVNPAIEAEVKSIIQEVKNAITPITSTLAGLLDNPRRAETARNARREAEMATAKEQANMADRLMRTVTEGAKLLSDAVTATNETTQKLGNTFTSDRNELRRLLAILVEHLNRLTNLLEHGQESPARSPSRSNQASEDDDGDEDDEDDNNNHGGAFAGTQDPSISARHKQPDRRAAQQGRHQPDHHRPQGSASHGKRARVLNTDDQAPAYLEHDPSHADEELDRPSSKRRRFGESPNSFGETADPPDSTSKLSRVVTGTANTGPVQQRQSSERSAADAPKRGRGGRPRGSKTRNLLGPIKVETVLQTVDMCSPFEVGLEQLRLPTFTSPIINTKVIRNVQRRMAEWDVKLPGWESGNRRSTKDCVASIASKQATVWRGEGNMVACSKCYGTQDVCVAIVKKERGSNASIQLLPCEASYPVGERPSRTERAYWVATFL